MIKIVYPKKKPAIKTQGEKEWIFCVIRKKWMILTPEEWVRQNLLLYFSEVLKYPTSLIAVEKQLQLSDLKKRFDIVLYKNEIPFILVECKEMNVPITQKTLDQVLRYNSKIQAGYFVITNGTDCYGFGNVEGEMKVINAFPVY